MESQEEALESLSDEQLDALYNAQYGAHSGAHQVYQAGRGELPELCSSCAIEAAIEAEQERRVRPAPLPSPASTPAPGEHYAVAIHPFPETGRVMVACRCGYFSGGVDGATWTFEYDGLGGVRTTPSLDVPGHFHTGNPSEFIQVVTTFGDFARERDRYARA